MAVEGWLFKASPAELAGGVGVISKEVFAREVYSYWAPLDQRFLEINTKIAHQYGFAMLNGEVSSTGVVFKQLAQGEAFAR